MLVKDILQKSFTKVNLFEGISIIKQQLISEKALVVTEDGKFCGLLAIEDLANRPHNIVADCISDKPAICWNKKVSETVECFSEYDVSVVPVFDNADNFQGLLFKNTVLEFLNTSMERQIQSLYNIAHDFKSPLSNIKSISHFLHDSGDEDRNKVLSYLSSSCNTMNEMIEDLLETATIENESNIIQNDINLVTIIEEVMKEFTPKINQSEIKLNFYKQTEQPLVHGNHFQLKRLFRNLLSNAFKFTPSGRKVEIIIKSTEANDPVVIVADEGMGMSEKMKEKLKESTIRKGKSGIRGERSNGLGLFIATKIANAHNASLHIDSREGSGTNVFVTFPAKHKTPENHAENSLNNPENHSG